MFRRFLTSLSAVAVLTAPAAGAFAYDTKILQPSVCASYYGDDAHHFNFTFGYVNRLVDGAGLKAVSCPILRDNEDERLHDMTVYLNNVLGTGGGSCTLYSYSRYGSFLGSETIAIGAYAGGQHLRWQDALGEIPAIGLASTYAISCTLPEGARLSQLSWTDKP